MSVRFPILDRYILVQVIGTFAAVMGVVISLMTLEHLPRLMEITRLSGHRGYIVAQTIAGLFPEYAGIGILAGLFLGVALTVRRLALRGELDVIEACGISPLRWMRFPFILAGIACILVFINQSWLMPAGEAQLDDIGRRMEVGEFGHRLPAGEFIDLGAGSVLLFRRVDASTGELLGLFLKTKEGTFSAQSGRLVINRLGETELELRKGLVLQEIDSKVLQFSRLHYRVDESASNRQGDDLIRGSKLLDSAALWEDGSVSSRSTVYGRSLWAALALIIPIFALPLGKPPRRQTGGAGILFGMALLVLALKMISPLIDGEASQPEALSAIILLSWGGLALGLIGAEKKFGQGFFDLAAQRVITKNQYLMKLSRQHPPASTRSRMEKTA